MYEGKQLSLGLLSWLHGDGRLKPCSRQTFVLRAKPEEGFCSIQRKMNTLINKDFMIACTHTLKVVLLFSFDLFTCLFKRGDFSFLCSDLLTPFSRAYSSVLLKLVHQKVYQNP